MRLPLSVFVRSMTLRIFGCTYLRLVYEFTARGACVARSFETVLCSPSSLITRECELTAITQNGPRLHGTDLSCADVAMPSAMRIFVPDKGDLSLITIRLHKRSMFLKRYGCNSIFIPPSILANRHLFWNKAFLRRVRATAAELVLMFCHVPWLV